MHHPKYQKRRGRVLRDGAPALFTASHETIIWARKEKHAKHTFNYRLMREGEWPEDKLKNPGSQMRSVWSIQS